MASLDTRQAGTYDLAVEISSIGFAPARPSRTRTESKMLNKQDFLYDKRLVERFIARGVLTRKEYQQHLAKLQDVADRAEPLVPDEELQSAGERETAE